MSAISLGACKVLLICYKYTFLCLDECVLCGSETKLNIKQHMLILVEFSLLPLHVCYMFLPILRLFSGTSM